MFTVSTPLCAVIHLNWSNKSTNYSGQQQPALAGHTGGPDRPQELQPAAFRILKNRPKEHAAQGSSVRRARRWRCRQPTCATGMS